MGKTISVALMCLLVATGCSSTVTEGVDGTHCKTGDGRAFVLKHRIGGLYVPLTVTPEKLKETLANIEAISGN